MATPEIFPTFLTVPTGAPRPAATIEPVDPGVPIEHPVDVRPLVSLDADTFRRFVTAVRYPRRVSGPATRPASGTVRPWRTPSPSGSSPSTTIP